MIMIQTIQHQKTVTNFQFKFLVIGFGLGSYTSLQQHYTCDIKNEKKNKCPAEISIIVLAKLKKGLLDTIGLVRRLTKKMIFRIHEIIPYMFRCVVAID